MIHVETSDVKDYDVHLAKVPVARGWQKVAIRFKDLEQGGWGKEVAFEAKNIIKISFQAKGNGKNDSLLIDNVYLQDSSEVPVEEWKGKVAVKAVNITVDGQSLNIPATPIYSTNANGYTECNHYQVYGPLKANSELKATSELPGVEFEISPVADGRATVRATYKGRQKVFLIN